MPETTWPRLRRSSLQSLWRVDFEGRPGVRLEFAYDRDFIEEFKRVIPHTERSWDAEDKSWWVSESQIEALRKLFINFSALYFDQVRVPR